MGFIYGLAVVLVIFEGIIIQCEGARDNLPKRIRNAPINDITEELPFLPNDLVETIISKTDFNTIHEAIQSYIVPVTNLITSRILQDHIIEIDINELFPDIHEYHTSGISFLKICSYGKLVQFFDRFGDQVKNVEINYSSLNRNVPHMAINQNIIKRCVKHLEELRFGIEGDWGFWEEISDGANHIIFPEVKKFQNMGCSSQNKFELGTIFPKLESLKLHGRVADVNCLANVRGLKELRLRTNSIKEYQLDDIFANNEHMTKIYLYMPERRETMHSIAKYLTKLETLGVEFPGENFWLRENKSEVFKLPSVKHVDIMFDEMDEIFGIGNLSFDMPNLKKLTLNGRQNDGEVVNFINIFKKLEIAELFVDEHIAIKCIEELQHVKEITATFYGIEIKSLKRIFERFDVKCKLQTLKFAYICESFYKFYEAEMKKINIHLRNFMKPTWTPSHGEQRGVEYLMFKRDP